MLGGSPGSPGTGTGYGVLEIWVRGTVLNFFSYIQTRSRELTVVCRKPEDTAPTWEGGRKGNHRVHDGHRGGLMCDVLARV